MPGIDREYLPLEFRREKVLQEGSADAALPVGGSDDGNGTRKKHRVKGAAAAHRSWLPPAKLG